MKFKEINFDEIEKNIERCEGSIKDFLIDLLSKKNDIIKLRKTYTLILLLSPIKFEVDPSFEFKKEVNLILDVDMSGEDNIKSMQKALSYLFQGFKPKLLPYYNKGIVKNYEAIKRLQKHTNINLIIEKICEPENENYSYKYEDIEDYFNISVFLRTVDEKLEISVNL